MGVPRVGGEAGQTTMQLAFFTGANVLRLIRDNKANDIAGLDYVLLAYQGHFSSLGYELRLHAS